MPCCSDNIIHGKGFYLQKKLVFFFFSFEGKRYFENMKNSQMKEN